MRMGSEAGIRIPSRDCNDVAVGWCRVKMGQDWAQKRGPRLGLEKRAEIGPGWSTASQVKCSRSEHSS